jgi:hypothetical protein
MRTVRASRYLTPLREGGSVPAIVEADDCGTYVVKFRGAAQGERALIAEVIAGELGRLLGLPVPQLVRVELDPILARSEPDPEIQATLKASGGVNIGLDYLPGALNWEPSLGGVDAELAAKIVWFDALVTNVDRTAKNPNMLRWHKQLYLIDHGAALVVTEAALRAIVADVPDDYLTADATPDATRAGYVAHLVDRLSAPRAFAQEAERARVA